MAFLTVAGLAFVFSAAFAQDVSIVQYGVSVYVDGTVSPDETGQMLLGRLLGGVFAIAA